ncbi:(deoxy)nucleoside triphosphate pyrophosphohydrolase [Macrococcus psychrotolerans]|uniref:(Deoxy)nucleoside triphosphate pyrophosphohydrolase n=1 Tax=Macrococcus psychrotolerans TaxID=3039389 RepID=A0AAT9P250_9STAP|nr:MULTISPECIES: (deoxy)nucleoside triphosphate pyrophosphohydrolase [Macrococcus]QYA32375.1 (deoxy)nucleoside triphosphate pyrophosphohydrolase [Macrococcus sp. 19Msa1099]QYA37182.1 (deoxy)nucleoside triphosphate pyrophosphohydrolase [Macrococcus caseolyticus]QYA75890.1 (deoxy)nucleoside triphosphate pyrophosphohydrolase [Macrococcus caseolyticus]
MKKYIKVVGAVIVKDGKILCAQRNEHTSLPLMWEFPGGKIEGNETSEEALIRELMEEMQCEISVGKKIVTTVHEYDFATIELTTFYAEMLNDQIVLEEHVDMKWLTPSELDTIKWAPADVEAVKKIMKNA